MSVGIILARRGPDGTRVPIPLEEWRRYVSEQADLRLRLEPYVAVNPKTGAKLKLPLGEADSEILLQGEWVPFLRFRKGSLVTEFRPQHDDPSNPERNRIASVATQLGAVLGTDAGDEALEW